MGFRSMFRRVRKPAVMALVAGSLALSLTVTTTQKAEATPAVAVAPVIAAAEGVLAGGVRLALPSLLSIAIATTPVGWIIGGGLAIGALGVGLYASRDYWVPFITGSFGTAGEKVIGSPTSNTFHDVSAYTRNGNAFALTVAWPATTVDRYVYAGVVAKCKNNSTGAIGYISKGGYLFLNTGQGAGSQVLNFTPCNPSFHTTLGWIVGGGQGSTLGSFTPNFDGTGAVTMIAAAGQYQYSTKNVRYGGDMGNPAFDPKGGDVKYKTTAECIDDGGNKSSITAEWFGDEGGAKIPSCAAAGKGHGTGKVAIEGYAPTAPGVPGTVPQPVWEKQAPTSDPDHPLCGPQRPGPGCEMKIAIDGKPCAVGVWECENWTEIWKDPTTAPRVGCTYGPYTLAVDLCRVMEPAYRPGGAPATEENMDGEPATRNYTNPGGSTYAPPATGTGLVPGAAGTAPAGSTPEQAQCFPSGWAMLNPIEWVMKPVGCAMEAAFKPQKDLQTRLAGMQGQFSNKVPMSWFGVGMEGVSGGACPADWAVEFKGQRYSLICGTEADNIIRGFRPVLGAMLTIAMLWPFVRSLFYAAIPVFKVTPS